VGSAGGGGGGRGGGGKSRVLMNYATSKANKGGDEQVRASKNR
jgi:hypothetical protein